MVERIKPKTLAYSGDAERGYYFEDIKTVHRIDMQKVKFIKFIPANKNAGDRVLVDIDGKVVEKLAGDSLFRGITFERMYASPSGGQKQESGTPATDSPRAQARSFLWGILSMMHGGRNPDKK